MPATNKPHVFVSSKEQEDVEKVKALLYNEVKKVLTYYEEHVPSSDADHLYFLKQHTLVSELNFNDATATYEVKGYKKE